LRSLDDLFGCGSEIFKIHGLVPSGIDGLVFGQGYSNRRLCFEEQPKGNMKLKRRVNRSII
jgi:hypothetical protein